jgi:hypothetical protein
MRFMVMVKATKDSEAGVMPSRELLSRSPRSASRLPAGANSALE